MIDVSMEVKRLIQHLAEVKRNILRKEDLATEKCVFMKVQDNFHNYYTVADDYQIAQGRCL